MNRAANNKEQTFIILNSLFDIRYPSNVPSNQQHLILLMKMTKFSKR